MNRSGGTPACPRPVWSPIEAVAPISTFRSGRVPFTAGYAVSTIPRYTAGLAGTRPPPLPHLPERLEESVVVRLVPERHDVDARQRRGIDRRRARLDGCGSARPAPNGSKTLSRNASSSRRLHGDLVGPRRRRHERPVVAPRDGDGEVRERARIGMRPGARPSASSVAHSGAQNPTSTMIASPLLGRETHRPVEPRPARLLVRRRVGRVEDRALLRVRVARQDRPAGGEPDAVDAEVADLGERGAHLLVAAVQQLRVVLEDRLERGPLRAAAGEASASAASRPTQAREPPARPGRCYPIPPGARAGCSGSGAVGQRFLDLLDVDAELVGELLGELVAAGLVEVLERLLDLRPRHAERLREVGGDVAGAVGPPGPPGP